MAKRQPFEIGPDFEGQMFVSESQSAQTFYVTSEDDVKKLPPEIRRLIEQARKASGRSGGITLAGDPGQVEWGIDLMQRAQMIVDAVRQAEETGQWDMARGFMSPRFFNRWQPWAQARLNSGSALPPFMSREITPAGGQNEATHDSAVMRVTESAGGMPTIRTLWVFLRNASARAGQPGQVFAGICSNCGAPIDPTQTSSCRYCGAGVVNLGPDWLLDDIRPDDPSGPR